MCGIAGFCNYSMDYTQQKGFWKDTLINMRKSIVHRGSDNAGEFLRKQIGLCHTRLSIRDLYLGAQPIVRNINGVEYVIVYNGEIYNTDELMPELKKEGHIFETTTDTEVGINFKNFRRRNQQDLYRDFGNRHKAKIRAALDSIQKLSEIVGSEYSMLVVSAIIEFIKSSARIRLISNHHTLEKR